MKGEGVGGGDEGWGYVGGATTPPRYTWSWSSGEVKQIFILSLEIERKG